MVSITPAMQTGLSCSCSHNISDIFSKQSLVSVNSDRIWWLWSCQKDASSPRKHLNCSTLNFLLQVNALALCKAKMAVHVSIWGTKSKFISCRRKDLNQILSDNESAAPWHSASTRSQIPCVAFFAIFSQVDLQKKGPENRMDKIDG